MPFTSTDEPNKAANAASNHCYQGYFGWSQRLKIGKRMVSVELYVSLRQNSLRSLRETKFLK